MWPLDKHDLRRLHNAMQCAMSRNRVSATTQPVYAQIEPTTACNLQCRFCLNPTYPSPRHSLSYGQFVEILDSLPSLLVVNLQGAGEPTLNKELFHMATEARRRKIYVFTVTNLNIQERVVYELAESDFNEINISLESVDPERYEWFRRGGSFALLESNLRLLADLKNRNKDAFPSIGIWISLTAATLSSVREVFEFANKSNVVERIQCLFLMDKESYVQRYDDDLRAQILPDRKEAANKVRHLLQAYSKQYGVRGFLVEGGCGWPWFGLSVNAEGEGLPAPCFNVKDYRNPLWGNIASGSLDEIYHSSNWISVREGLLSGIPHSVCRGCPYVC